MLQDVYTNEEDLRLPLDTPACEELDQEDDDGVGKVTDWLRLRCSSSDVNADKTLFFKRDSIARRKVRKTEFPGNWKLIPKSIEQFPSRFSNQCHQTHCDRCDVRNRQENSTSANNVCVNAVHNQSVEIKLEDFVTQPQKRSDVRSHSSDSAIGGSGERLWNEQRTPLLPEEAMEAEILQELIQPEDSASACPTNEPYPDYPRIRSGFESYRSYSSELSLVLREFEGNLTKYECPVKGPLIEVLDSGLV